MTRAMLGIYRNAQKPTANPDVLLERTGDGYPYGTLPGLIPTLKTLRDMLSFESFHCLTMEIEDSAHFFRQTELCWIANMQYFYRLNCDEQELIVYRSEYNKDRFRRQQIARIDLNKPFDVENPHLNKIGCYWIEYKDGSESQFSTLKEGKDFARNAFGTAGAKVLFKLNDNFKPVIAAR